MLEKSLEVLEFPKVLRHLASFTSFSASHELALSLTPHYRAESAIRSQREALEADRLLELRPSLSLGSIRDVRPLVEQARLGAVLAAQELTEIGDTLAGTRSLRESILSLATDVPLLAGIAQELDDHPTLVEEIKGSIGPRGEVMDGASPLLGPLRRELKRSHDVLTDRMWSVVNSQSRRNMLQEPIITQRANRYVLPVKADFRGEFKGIVHDVSASGATFFMEPLEVVEMGNSWRELQLREVREIEKVLRNLSALVGEWAAMLVNNTEATATIDLALAKAKYGHSVRGSFPTLAPTRGAADKDGMKWPITGTLRLVNARHPLLSGSVVPISVEMGEEYFIAIITGPNTGGKTVALKSIGLLSLMAQAGMPIPADPGCVLPVFGGIYADIGDEQSIEQSLSTFSSHMSNIIHILEAAGDDSLVLLDELAAGTDPQDGSALARAILAHLLERGITTVATTHHSELKAYAHSTPGVVNASVEFDSETLAPTYKLSIGLPGRSNALAIAERLGVPRDILETARASQSPSQLQVEGLLSQIQEERDRAVSEHRAAEARLQEAETANQLIQEQLREIEASRDRMVEAARAEIADELRELRMHIHRASEEIERGLRELARERLQSAAKEVEVVQEKLEEPGWRPASHSGGRRVVDALIPGSRVWVKGIEQIGHVLTPPNQDGEVDIQVGVFKVRANREQLEVRDDEAHTRVSQPYGVSAYRTAHGSTPSNELHLRGMRVEESLEQLDSFLNEAFLAGMSRVRIVHGKGTGTLRRAVHESLARHSLIKSYATAPAADGGEGVTVVELET